ncbi:hypothetical protein LRAMOSA03074 [Lichtheimia ramosa]|uniref:Heterokaryon incompatibility domain-containing protein n=1 Tax=Lichtheimia ramosa TaxID=688394 RepID=A0A077WTJ8_9FUNG|nr:hypothetical protein LRAMOSA03074 [Lichtheimia ramosa]
MLNFTSEGVDSPYQEKQYDRDLLAKKAQIELLQNPNFLLLYVPGDGSKMKVVKPANDSYHRGRIMESSINEGSDRLSLPHYALSHLWGISEENPHLWHDIGDFVEDENGQPADIVSMRPEKRDTLLKLLEHHPDSYWWIDVLCARADTPLDIMGDIYKHCRTCYAMLDCESHIISDIQSLVTCEDRIPRTVDGFWHAARVWETFTRCAWWKRVWTWQEMMLPKQVLLIAETETHVWNTIDMDHLFPLRQKAFRPFTTTVPVEVREQWRSSPSYSRVNEINYCTHQRSDFQRLGPPSFIAINTLKRSSRRCMKPEDYVYGVLGVLQFKLPRGIEPNELWQLFVSQVDEALKDSGFAGVGPHAREFNLLAARDMADVFLALLENENDHIS